MGLIFMRVARDSPRQALRDSRMRLPAPWDYENEPRLGSGRAWETVACKETGISFAQVFS